MVQPWFLSSIYPNKRIQKTPNLTHGEVIRMYRKLSLGSYQFRTMYRLFIPKAPGKVGVRPITIPHRLDRALLRALHLMLTEALNPLMEPTSHGFLPYRGALTLYAELCNWQGVTHLKFLDVRKCFETLKHEKVTELLSLAGAPPAITKLIGNSPLSATLSCCLTGTGILSINYKNQ